MVCVKCEIRRSQAKIAAMRLIGLNVGEIVGRLNACYQTADVIYLYAIEDDTILIERVEGERTDKVFSWGIRKRL